MCAPSAGLGGVMESCLHCFLFSLGRNERKSIQLGSMWGGESIFGRFSEINKRRKMIFLSVTQCG